MRYGAFCLGLATLVLAGCNYNRTPNFAVEAPRFRIPPDYRQRIVAWTKRYYVEPDSVRFLAITEPIPVLVTGGCRSLAGAWGGVGLARLRGARCSRTRRSLHGTEAHRVRLWPGVLFGPDGARQGNNGPAEQRLRCAAAHLARMARPRDLGRTPKITDTLMRDRVLLSPDCSPMGRLAAAEKPRKLLFRRSNRRRSFLSAGVQLRACEWMRTKAAS